MKNRNKYFITAALVLSGGVTSFSIVTISKIPEFLLQNNSGDCQECHSDLINKKTIHYPATEACTDCHIRVKDEHPATVGNSFELMDVLPALCYYCHESYGQKKYPHYPATEGLCLDCHSPHATENEHLIKAMPTEKTCVECHDNPTNKMSISHKPVSIGECERCHEPHESENRHLLKKKGKKLCFDCHHEIEALMEKKHIHIPFEEDCGTCHESHASNNQKLLTGKPEEICYSCHEPLTNADFIHKPVASGQCSACHNPHASDLNVFLNKSSRKLCLDEIKC